MRFALWISSLVLAACKSTAGDGATANETQAGSADVETGDEDPATDADADDDVGESGDGSTTRGDATGSDPDTSSTSAPGESGESGEPTADGWAIVDIGTDADLLAVDFADASHGWIVGSDELLLHTADGGASWTSQSAGFFADTVDTVQVQAHVIQPGPSWGVYHLIDVHAVSPDIAWAASVGPLVGPPSLDADNLSAVFVTSDAGSSWTRLTLATNFQVWGIFGFDAASARAATIGASDHPDSDIYRIEGGASQSSVPMTFLGLRDLAFLPDGTGLTVGSGGIFRAAGTDDWTTANAPGAAWWSIALASDTVAFVVGEGGAIARSVDGGVGWESQTSGTTQHLYGVSFVDEGHGFAVGDPGVALRTDDGGATWVAEDSRTTAFLNDVAATGSTTAWATGDGGVLLRRQ